MARIHKEKVDITEAGTRASVFLGLCWNERSVRKKYLSWTPSGMKERKRECGDKRVRWT